MILVGKSLLNKFMRKHANSRKSLRSWVEVVENSVWEKPADIKEQFNSVDFLGDNKVIFNIGGNNYRLFVQIVYVNKIVKVEWIGTHSEYDRKTFT